MSTPYSRLLDLLHGWADNSATGLYADKSFIDYSDRIEDLYSIATSSEKMTDGEIKCFLLEKVFPIIQNPSSQAADDNYHEVIKAAFNPKCLCLGLEHNPACHKHVLCY